VAHTSGDEADEITGINVTPLVDITLVLLIIFMVTAKLVVSQAMPLDLPKAASAGEVQSMMMVVIDGQGAMQVNGRGMGDAELARFAAAERARVSDVRAVLTAARSVSHGQVMHALDVLRSAGITKVAFGAEKIP
jgi:biopolymer transport protein ExbD